MTTLEAPSVTPCPVPWCPDNGHHVWTARPDHSAEPERWHTATVLEFVDDDGAAHPRVTAEQYETAGYSQTTVELFNGHAQLLDWGEVNELVDAIKRAADVAFGPSPLAEHEAELDAAAAELITRAGHPEDVNRLVAAAIRFRQAYLAVDAELDAEEKAEVTR